MDNLLGYTQLKNLTRLRDLKTRRVSTWNRSGANFDFQTVPPGQTHLVAEIQGCGCITHLWFTLLCKDPHYLRKILLRMYWDGEHNPSVHVPLGDFFGVGHAEIATFCSQPLNMVIPNRENAHKVAAMNCYFQMPYADGARVELVNEADCEIESLFYYVDYEEYRTLPPDTTRFHAQWRRENLTDGLDIAGKDLLAGVFALQNATGAGNYVILEAKGRGHYVGCNLSVHNVHVGDKSPLYDGKPFDWWGEGDDMIFVDDDTWPPSIHGTGTEDYFCHAWGMHAQAYPYAGSSFCDKANEKYTCYRFHIEDPIVFQESIRVTIEHGHANSRSNDYSSVAYWYQLEPHLPFPPIMPAIARLPRPK